MQSTTSEERCYLRKETNPYHEKLKDFNQFVYLDHQAEAFKGKWQQEVFQNTYPLKVELGVGYGEFMAHYCAANPQTNFVGLDIRFKRSFGVAKKLSALEHKNFRLLRVQGQRLPWLFQAQEVDEIFCFFPDPWPKAKQHKKRLFQADFLKQLSVIIKKGGHLYFKTDHLDMFRWVLGQLEQVPEMTKLWQSFDLYADYQQLTEPHLKNLAFSLVTFQTKFEKIFLQQKTPIKALIVCPR